MRGAFCDLCASEGKGFRIAGWRRKVQRVPFDVCADHLYAGMPADPGDLLRIAGQAEAAYNAEIRRQGDEGKARKKLERSALAAERRAQ